MNKQRLLDIQVQRGAKNSASDLSTKTLDWTVSACRRYIQDRATQYRNMETSLRRDKIRNLIINYVTSDKPQVDGYIDANGKTDTNRLIETLIDSIQNYGFLTDAMTDEKVFEIRGNGKEIKIERNGRCMDLTDADGNILTFDSPEQQLTILSKFLGDVRLSRKDAAVSARTVEGFRIAAVHSSATGDDPNSPNAEKYHVFVLRKFNKNKMGLPDIVKKKTMSDDMARTLSLAMEGGLTFFTAGPTASGKSTTNNAILQCAPDDTRVVLLQNPSEIDLRKTDETGRIINDVIHLEYIEKENPGPYDPTSAHMMEQILRLSPTFVAFGEWRSNKEFKLGIQIGQAGHPLNSTLHAEDSIGAISRILTAYLAESGNEPAELALIDITSVTNMIVIQKIMRDGTRKVLQITEVLGVDPTNRTMPLLNDLYVFVAEGEPVYDELGRIKEIPGYHKRVGKLSNRTIDKLKKEGISMSRIDFLLEDVDLENPKIETYTGEDIIGYNKHKVYRKGA